MKENSEYTPNEVIDKLKILIKANDDIISKGELPISLSLIGPHGIGKTSLVRELAQELGKSYCKVNLSQIQEVADLQGYYSKEYEMVKDNNYDMVTENLLPTYISNGYHRTGKVITKPCPPEWVSNLKDNSILMFDDKGRQNSLISQALMEILNEQTFPGWDLRSKKIQIICTENPDDGYNVQSEDDAHTDRYFKLHMKWDANSWAYRAEKLKMDSRLINFILNQPELLENKKKDGISASGQVSPRMLDKFLSTVATIDEWDKHLDVITSLGDMSVGKDLTSQLINFIHKKLDKLPSIEKLIREKKNKSDDEHWDLATAKAALTECCGDSVKDSANWRAATAAILSMRIANYCIHYHKDLSKDEVKRVGELASHSSFGIDQRYMIVKKLVGLGNQWAMLLAGDPRFIDAMKQ